MRRRFVNLLERLGASSPAAVVHDELMERYGEAHRLYHRIEHIASCLEYLDSIVELCGSPDTVELALWFHDAVYEPGRCDNEERSASLLLARCGEMGVPVGTCAAAAGMVRATRRHVASSDPDTNLLIDIDLAILGAPVERYREYAAGIRAEHRRVPALLYEAGRARFLRKMLEAPHIYKTAHFRRRLEAQARQNLTAELALYPRGHKRR